jgi:sec-independent protein translocase protein TatC
VATRLRPVGHEDRLSLVEHLDELRTRLIIGLAVFGALFGVCFWQNETVIDIVNRPVEQTAFKKSGTKDPLEQSALFSAGTKESLASSAAAWAAIAADPEVSPEIRGLARIAHRDAERAVALAPKASARRPVTLGIGEPFFATIRVAGYAALLLALPVILWQLYAFVLPAFSPRERSVALPLMSLVPFLFYAGVAFAYFVVLPNAIDFLQNFNDDQFDILIQAKELYRFSIMVLLIMGACFQIPVGILLLTRMEIVSVAQLRANRRYAILVIAILAMFLPGTDPVTMLLCMAPLLVLYEGSILLAALLDRRASRAVTSDDAGEDGLPILHSDQDDD